MIETTLDGKTKNIVQDNIEQLKQLFPEIITEDKIDFDKLREILGEEIDDTNERYDFTWEGKHKATKIALNPSEGTLRPDKESSKNWDTTENLYIEGDNLEVLKLLQKSYYEKIKLIYLDPPYNTGNDFVYEDNFTDNLKNYLKQDGEGFNVSSNPETSGRYHTNWLNMMYSRLKLARNLLKKDGVIFIHIDDNELSNLKKIMDELFGESCFINLITIKTKVAGVSGSHLGKSLQNNAEYILMYCKNNDYFQISNIPKDKMELYSFIENMKLNNKSWKYTTVMKSEGDKEYVKSITDGSGDEIKIYKHSNYEFVPITKISKNEFNNNLKKAYYSYINQVFRTTNAQSSIRKKIMDETKDISSDLISIEYIPTKGKNAGKLTRLYYKDNKRNLIAFLKEVVTQNSDGIFKLDNKGNIWTDINYNNLKNEAGLSFPNGQKPIQLLNYLLDMFNLNNEIILDFFSGSASTAHSTIDYNRKNDKKNKFIMVQLPEKISKKDKLSKNFSNICEIGEERIRLVGDKLLEENPHTTIDVGFKVFKLDSSNITKWNPDVDNLEDTLINARDNIVDGRSELDLVYEIMLKYGLELTLPVEKIKQDNYTFYSVGMGSLIVCLNDHIRGDIAEDIIKIKNELSPSIMRVVFKDNGFESDSDKTNIKEILRNNEIDEFITI